MSKEKELAGEKIVVMYLTYDRRAHCWVKISDEDSRDMKKRVSFLNSGYSYTDVNNQKIVELYVDASHIFEDRMNSEAKFAGKQEKIHY